MRPEFREVARRECPEGVELVYMANESGNHVIRYVYRDGKEFVGSQFHIFGNPIDDEIHFEKVADADKGTFLRKYWKPD